MEKVKKIFNSEIKAIDEKNMELTALVSTNAIDRYREVIDPDGMDAKSFKQNPVVLWAHDYSQPPIGKALWIRKEGNGIVSKVKFANTEKAKEVFELYKDGFMKAFSIGFMPITTENMPMDEDEMPMDKPKKPRRIYKKWELLEFSAVPVPANPEALALCVQRGIISDEKKVEIERKGFEVDDWNEEEPKKKEEEKQEIPGERGLEELFAEIEYHSRKIIELEDLLKQKDVEIKDFILTIINQQKQIEKLKESPGITVGQLGEKIVEVADGVIRKHLGKT